MEQMERAPLFANEIKDKSGSNGAKRLLGLRNHWYIRLAPLYPLFLNKT